MTSSVITGKIYIKKKSGPGEITGITELQLSDDGYGVSNVRVKDLQFTEPGDYVIEISSDSNLIIPKQINAKVLPQDDIIAQPVSKQFDNNSLNKTITGNRPIISQIDKPSISVPSIKMNTDGSNSQGAYTTGLGYTPFLWYNAYQIEERYIYWLKLYHDGIVPKVQFIFEDNKDIIRQSTPTDDTKIELFLNSTSSNLKSLHMIFKIENFEQLKSGKGVQKYKITGTVNVPSLYVVNNNSYNGTSFEVLRNISKEMGLGFNSNIDNTNDSMSWRNTFKKPYEFINDIISRSYISDESFTVGYIDYYYCFNYVDIEKEMNRDISNDFMLDSSPISGLSKDDSDKLSPLFLTNDKSMSSYSSYIESFSTINESTKKSLKEGYSTNVKYYDRINKQFLVFNVDSTTSDGSKNIILKGAQYDDSYVKENITHKFLGKLDTDNVNVNYNYASVQNRINLFNLNKIVIMARLPNANWNLYKFQKVKVNITNDVVTPISDGLVNHRYSGEYIIADIEYNWTKGKISQQLRLVRKELSKTPDEIKNQPPVSKKPQETQINVNPTPGLTSSSIVSPNGVYVVDETYKVQDNKGNLYQLTITKLLENGIEVSGKLKKII